MPSRYQQNPCPFGSRSIGVAILRRDGFIGLQASVEGINGQLTTKPMTLVSDHLRINVEQRDNAGAVTVALLDDRGRELPGFGFDDSIPITADAVRHPVRWKTFADLRSIRDHKVRLSLRIHGGAIVYAVSLAD